MRNACNSGNLKDYSQPSELITCKYLLGILTVVVIGTFYTLLATPIRVVRLYAHTVWRLFSWSYFDTVLGSGTSILIAQHPPRICSALYQFLLESYLHCGP